MSIAVASSGKNLNFSLGGCDISMALKSCYVGRQYADQSQPTEEDDQGRSANCLFVHTSTVKKIPIEILATKADTISML